MTKPPVRLLDDPSVASGLRANLQRVRVADADYDAARGLDRLHESLQLIAAVKPAAASGLSALKLSAAKLLLLSALGATAWVGTQFVLTREPTAPAVSGRELTAAPDEHVSGERSRAASRSAPAPVAPATRPHQDSEGIRREIEQLAQIRVLLPVDPNAAFALAERSAREFPYGALREEREALTVLALERLGERARAREAARAFLARYPQSPLRAALEGVAQEQP